jgi:amino acid transporter
VPPPHVRPPPSPARSHSSFLAELCEAPTRDPDEESSVRLAALGYKQELYRGFSAFMSFSIDFSCFSAITSISVLYRFSLTHGGPMVMICGWVVTWFMTLLCALVMGEICSTYPLAGSVYAWAGELCSVEWAPLCSFWTGIFHLLGYVAR